MVSYMRYLFLIPLLLLMACGKNEFYLEFDLQKDVTENYTVNYYATDIKGGVTIQAVASVREGKCELKGVTKRPTIAYITNRNSKLPLVVYAERGNKIDIKEGDVNPLTWVVEGNDINREISQWRQNNLEVLLNNETDSINAAVGIYVEENPENPVSTILMLCYYDRKSNERGYAALMSSIKGIARSTEWLDLIGRSDQLFHKYSYPARLESMIMRSNKEGADTISVNGKNPLFLLFWQTGENQKKEIVDSLKVLEKELPDSAILIADICLDPDSTGWKNSIRRDSIKITKRFWAPMGLTDRTVMKLKVPTIPYYMVFNKGGEEEYRGTELSEAINEYRRLYHLKDTVKP